LFGIEILYGLFFGQVCRVYGVAIALLICDNVIMGVWCNDDSW